MAARKRSPLKGKPKSAAAKANMSRARQRESREVPYKVLAVLEWEAAGAKGEAPKQQPIAGEYAAWWNAMTVGEKRVEEIVQLMAGGRFLSGVTTNTLARLWGLHPRYVNDLVMEASRVLRRQVRDGADPTHRNEIRAAVIQTFAVIQQRALMKGDPNSLRVALDATRAYGWYCGVQPTVDVTVRDSRDDEFEGWTPDEMKAYAQDGKRPRRALKQVQREIVAEGVAVLANGNGHDDDGSITRH